MSRSSEVYALKLFEDAFKVEQIEQVRTELRAVISVLQSEPRVFELLSNPVLRIEEKQETIRQIFSNQIREVLSEFLSTLLQENAFDALGEIEQQYSQGVRQYLEDYKGIIEGDVYSAIPLSENQMQKLADTFSKKLGKQVRFTSTVDKSLIGGYRVSIKDKVFDDSIKYQLGQLKETLTKSNL